MVGKNRNDGYTNYGEYEYTGNEIQHPEYVQNKSKWQVVEDICDSNYKPYVIPPMYTQSSNGNVEKTNNYIARARFYNFTLNTANGLVGTALQKKPTIELSPALKYLEESATNNGLTLYQLLQLCIFENVKKGRIILLTDFPAVPEGTTLEEETNNPALRARIYAYTAEEVETWAVDNTTGEEILTMVALREVNRVRVDNAPGQLEYVDCVQYKVFEIDENGECIFYIMDDLVNGGIVEGGEPRVIKANGTTLDFIPVTCIGSENNDWHVDTAPMFPIAHANIGHLRNSASLEFNIEAHGRITVGISSKMSTSQWQEAAKSNPMVFGADNYVWLGDGGDMKTYQAAPNQLASVAMTQKEDQIQKMGGQMLTTSSDNAPVETTRLNMNARLSPLETIVNNVVEGINTQLDYIAIFQGVPEDESYIQLPLEFTPKSADPAMIQALTASWVAGGLPQTTLVKYAQSVDLEDPERDPEEIIAEVTIPDAAGLDFSTNETEEATIDEVDESDS